MIKCPRCSNESIKQDYRYCPICGLELETAQDVPVQEQLYNQHMKEKRIAKNVCIIIFLLFCISIYFSFKFIN